MQVKRGESPWCGGDKCVAGVNNSIAASQDLILAYDLVLVKISEYLGEPMEAGKHPLHVAVHRLEKLCRIPREGSTKQHKLFSPAAAHWFRSLWASRDGQRNTPLDLRWTMASREGGPPNPQLAMDWSASLERELEKQVTALRKEHVAATKEGREINPENL